MAPHLYANCGVKFLTKFRLIVSFDFRGGRGGGSKKNGHYFPFSSDVELYLRAFQVQRQETKVFTI